LKVAPAGVTRECTQFLEIARGSASELEYHPLLAHDLRLLNETRLRRLHSKVVEGECTLPGLVKRIQPVLVRKRMPNEGRTA
jgi:four helix bundle protein